MRELIIRQIIPAPDNLYVVYEDDKGEFESKVICLALLDNDEIVMMDSDDLGVIEESVGYKKIIYK